MKKETTRLKFEGDRVMTIVRCYFDYQKIKTFLEKHTGLIYGKGNFYSQTVGVLEAWKSCHSPEHELSLRVTCYAKYFIAYSMAKEKNGYTAYSEGSEKELVVYVPSKEGDYFIDIDELFENLLAGEYDYDNSIWSVEKVANEITLVELEEELVDAVNSENYELAATLRDQINSIKDK